MNLYENTAFYYKQNCEHHVSLKQENKCLGLIIPLLNALEFNLPL